MNKVLDSGLPDHTNPRHVPGRAHIEWCRERALSALSRGELGNALGTLNADLMRDPSTKHIKPPWDELTTVSAARKFVENMK